MRVLDEFPAGTAALLLLGTFFAVPIMGWGPVIATVLAIGAAVFIHTKLH